jgi:hypothetical protein
MRASDLLDAPVRGTSGEDLGCVVDVRLVQDGPLLGAFAAMRVDGLIVGRRRLASRLGYDRHEARRPAAIRVAVRWWTRHNRYLPWSAVTLAEEGLTADPAALVPVPLL